MTIKPQHSSASEKLKIAIF